MFKHRSEKDLESSSFLRADSQGKTFNNLSRYFPFFFFLKTQTLLSFSELWFSTIVTNMSRASNSRASLHFSLHLHNYI